MRGERQSGAWARVHKRDPVLRPARGTHCETSACSQHGLRDTPPEVRLTAPIATYRTVAKDMAARLCAGQSVVAQVKTGVLRRHSAGVAEQHMCMGHEGNTTQGLVRTDHMDVSVETNGRTKAGGAQGSWLS